MKTKTLLIVSALLLSSCALKPVRIKTEPLPRSEFYLPEVQPLKLHPVTFEVANDMFCLSGRDYENLAINVKSLEAHIVMMRYQRDLYKAYCGEKK